jgi:hypothetical protein
MKDNKPGWLYVLIILSIEKFFQHLVVSYSFFVDYRRIRGSVAVDYQILLISGFIVGILFLTNIPFLYQQRHFSFILLFSLAMFDFIGEFIAQGTPFINITVSFSVAIAIIVILLIHRKHLV